MKKIMFLCPYFGKLPAHTPLWLTSCAANPTVTWHLFTDDKTPYPYPKNVEVTYTTLEALRERFQTKFDFRISLPGVYKLGDCKPLFGYLFEEELKGYDAWGHIDVADEIYGDIRHFVTDELLEKYDKIMLFGHMCIYKNTPEVNRRFMASTGTELNYQDIFSSDEFYNFEEIAQHSITRIYQNNAWPIGRLDEAIADVHCLTYYFGLGKWDKELRHYQSFPRQPLIFSYEHGKTYGYSVQNGKVIRKEYAYIHFKRRNMLQQVPNDVQEFCIVPSGFVAKPAEITADFIAQHSKDKLFYRVYWQEKKKGLLRRWKKVKTTAIKRFFTGAKAVAACLPDKQFLQLKYWYIFRKRLNLKNPQTFNEKLQWLKLYDRNPLYTTLVDKYSVKKWVADKIGEEYIIPTLGVWDKAEDIDFDNLPNQFVLKCTHDSGSIVICKDKRTFNRQRAIAKLNNGLAHNFYVAGREWPYKNVKPRIIAEEYMEDKETTELRDYKFFCFNGKVKLLFVATDRQRAKEPCFDFYDTNFVHLSIKHGHPNSGKVIKQPMNFEKMKILAHKLSMDIPQVRVDFYEINGKVYFGELTFFHHGGFVPFNPPQWNNTLGKWIQLPEKVTYL